MAHRLSEAVLTEWRQTSKANCHAGIRQVETNGYVIEGFPLPSAIIAS
jgi:hypothetical protein